VNLPVPPLMAATRLTGHGGVDKLVYSEDVPTPEPSAGEVLVQVGACGVNNTDINTRSGWYDRTVVSAVTESFGSQAQDSNPASSWNDSTVTFPRIQGAAVAGRIAAVGAGVDASRIGERVLVDPSVRDPSRPPRAQLVEYLGSERDGGFAQYVAVPAVNAHHITTELTDEELATFPCSYDTAEEMLERAALAAGETIIVTGAAGGVGTALVQLALVRDAHVIAIAGSSKRERVLGLGAHEFIPRDHGDLGAAVRDLVGSRNVAVAADVVGGAMFEILIGLLQRGGRYTSAGAVGGPMTQFDLRELVYKDLEMFGITNPTAQTFARVKQLIEAGSIKPMLDGSFPLDQLGQAQVELLKREHFGKFVITPG
jgi:NADPH:quinone reductase-like Zn-dependent oxidoreductase